MKNIDVHLFPQRERASTSSCGDARNDDEQKTTDVDRLTDDAGVLSFVTMGFCLLAAVQS